MLKRSWSKNGYTVTEDLDGVDIDAVCALIAAQGWGCRNRPDEMNRTALAHSHNFVCLCGGRPVGLARMVTDYATMAYVTDVCVAPDHQGRGVARFLMECIVGNPPFGGMRRLTLCTPDARGLYAKFGFVPVARPEEWMERMRPYEEAYAYFAENGGDIYSRYGEHNKEMD